MFLHLLKYKLKSLFREKDLLGWVFAFPLVLGTFFYLAFGNMMNSDEYNFNPVPVAFVSEGNTDATFESVLDSLSKDTKDRIFEVTKTGEGNAKELLKKGRIDGIIYTSPELSVMVSGDGINKTIIKSFLEGYLKNKAIYEQIGSTHPEKLESAVSILSKNISFNKEISFSNTKMNSLSQYFFALIAMTCLYGSFMGSRAVEDIQANLSAIGARRGIAPAHKLKVIFADYLGAVIVNYSSILILFFYLIVILKIDFGTRIPYILATGFLGSVIGVSMGTFTGSISKISASLKGAIMSALSLILSFLSGLMIGNMKDIVEHHAPLLNRINPAALITDCLYSLNMYESFDRFYSDIAIMGVIAALLITGSYLLLRRTRYENIPSLF
ncbi:ABC transporter permease [Anaerocolumna xylanovorans]|uniref:ABC-2 type transport system permease protein n=1 Tax=Anaerocolumna xylanovorans DSM 12503 TaxID=1121345 RepID=A0A1M7Y7A3_9FIRM|nr:ABC transporter permease [Anaerocolumna xylanovorans]SHO48406.1 ABC-2 type transport system permease protein [Anaerocolumna xylanovorans DSM 12503]